MKAQYEKTLEAAKTVARAVGGRILREARSDTTATITHKGVSDLVTEIDIWSEQQILQLVASDFPEHLVIGEETSTVLAERRGLSLPELVAENICWVVDPLDGTTNFSNKIPHCAVSIGIVDRGVRVAGVVYDPFREELFEAIKGEGAYLNGKRITASQKTELLQSVIALGFPNDRWIRWDEYKDVTEALIMSCRNARACGAAAIEICWVGCGRFDAFFEYNIKAWDVAAASLIMEEAGGAAKSFQREGSENFSLFAQAFLFCGAKLRDDLVEVIRTRKPLAPIASKETA